MSEARPYRHTAGDWGKHPAYEFKPIVNDRDTGECYVFCHVPLSSGHKIIATVEMSTAPDGVAWPTVKNLIEMKANLALMSAAPDFVEAVGELLDEDDKLGTDNPVRMPEAIRVKLKTAFAKATTY